MGAQKTKRVWETVSTAREGDGYAIYLDGRRVRTPAKSPLTLPTKALALKIEKEWAAQGDHIEPATMPFTRTANSAIDRVAPQMAEVADILAAYGDSDLLCYRAERPTELVARQSRSWDPVLDWAAAELGARLVPRTGVIHVPQFSTETARLAAQVHAFSNFELAGFHDLVALSGSLILAFATIHELHDAAKIWALSRLDESWQIEQWGEDDAAKALDSVKRNSFLDAEKFCRLVREKA